MNVSNIKNVNNELDISISAKVICKNSILSVHKTNLNNFNRSIVRTRYMQQTVPQNSAGRVF